ncbi:RNA polymerase sigma-70 factor [uncultured Draconibacterium sp.]|uniref:RNA polymerase sigma-70 factor n=1 Tax=uncultured Draconibacterium sp. TaxID=1573823 RepID=UPI003217C214
MSEGLANIDQEGLVEKIRNDDETAFKLVFNEYYSKLYYFTLEFIPQKETAENIVQDTFFTFWKKRHTLNRDTNLTAYLFTITKNNCLYRLRDLRYRNKLINNSIDIGELELNIDSLKSFDTSDLAFNEIQSIIRLTLEELPPQCRKVFELSRFHDKKNKEIAEELNISIKTVEGHISKGLKVFKEALKEYLPIASCIWIL